MSAHNATTVHQDCLGCDKKISANVSDPFFFGNSYLELIKINLLTPYSSATVGKNVAPGKKCKIFASTRSAV
ncbi:MAG: hypothetical protein EAS48_00100 [Chryseobacterium sp.]|nr:MAG: hypothetical protein EAS48_00100 [Chryseobacterium sp.]